MFIFGIVSNDFFFFLLVLEGCFSREEYVVVDRDGVIMVVDELV